MTLLFHNVFPLAVCSIDKQIYLSEKTKDLMNRKSERSWETFAKDDLVLEEEKEIYYQLEMFSVCSD